MINTEERLRSRVGPRCGGKTFDAVGTGYSFSNVLAEERDYALANVPGYPSSVLCCLSVADPTGKMPLEAMQAGMDYYASSPNATRYTDNNGIPGTHERIAGFLNATHPAGGVKFTNEWVQYSAGSIKRALAEFMPSLLLDRETILFFPDPSYPVIKSDINRRGAIIENIPLIMSDGRYHINYGKMTTRIVESGAKKAVLYLNIPHNPTGTTFSRTDWENLIAWATENDVIVVVDEAYTHLRFDHSVSVLDVPGWEQCCIVLQSVSKGWNATGLRMGWMIAHPLLIKAIRKVTDVKDSGGFGPSIASALWCLDNPQFAAGTCDQYRGLHTALIAGLREAGFEASMPDAGLCLLTKAPKAIDGTMFADATECTRWLRKARRISLMPSAIGSSAYLRWAVTISPNPECGLPDHGAVIAEVVRRFKTMKLEF